MTTYIILRSVETLEPRKTWERIGSQEASSPKAALRQHHAQHELDNYMYAVVPARNWTEIAVETVTETRLVFR